MRFCVRRLSAGVWLGFVAAFAPLAVGAEFETPVALEGATIVTKPGNVIESGTIVIEDGRITAVGSDVDVPADALRIDASGLYVYPGFIDALSHVGMPEGGPDEEEIERLGDEEQVEKEGPRTSMQLANRNGIWPYRTVRGGYEKSEGKLEGYRDAGFTTAFVTPHPAILGGTGDVLQLSGQPLRRSLIAQDIGQIVDASRPDFEAEGYPRVAYPTAANGAIALIRQTFLDADRYRKRQQLADEYPTEVEPALSDPVLDAVLTMRDEKRPMFLIADDPDVIHHRLDLAEELGQSAVIVGGKEAWKVAYRLAATDTPVIVSLDWDEKPELAPKKDDEEDGAEEERDMAATWHTTVSWSPEWEEQYFEPLRVRRERVKIWEDHVRNVRSLIHDGVQVAVTARDLDKPGELLKNLRTAIEHGLSADEALQVLTVSPAKIIGIEEQTGTISSGKLANLVVMTAPLEDEDAKVRHVFVGGERFDMDAERKKEEDEESEEEGDDEEKTEDDSDEEKDEEEEKSEPEDRYPWASEIEDDREPQLSTYGDVLLKNATVLTVTDGVKENTDVFVRDGVIREIGQNLDVADYVDVIDLTGYWLMPGIVDPHSHMAIKGGINEYSEAVTAEVRIADILDPTQRALFRALAGGVTTIHTMHGSANPIGGQNAVMKLKYNWSPSEALIEQGPPLVKFALGENVTRANWTSLRGTRFPMSRMGVEAVIRQAFNDALEYQQEWDEYEANGDGPVAPPRRDVRLDALRGILAGDIWVHSHCYRSDEILRLLDACEDYGVRVACLQHVLEGYRILPEMYRHGVAGSTFSDWWAYKIEASDASPYNAAMMYDAGIVSSINSDDAGVVRHLNLEASKSIRFGGLRADEALKLITINPAIQLGIDDLVGSIEVGKDGDFAVFTHHPLDVRSKAVLTIIEGIVWFQHRDFEQGAGPGSEFVPQPPRDVMEVAKNDNGRYLIKGATVHPVSSDPIENGVVLVEGGKIAAVGSSVDASGATVVDASGLHVYPGLINAGTQLSLVEIPRIPAVNDTEELAYMQPHVQSVSAVNPHSVHVPIARAEGTTTAFLIPEGGVISGHTGVIDMTGWTMPEMLREKGAGLVMDLPSLPANIDEDDRKERLKKHGEAMKRIEDFIRQAKLYANVRGDDGKSTEDMRLDAMVPFVNGEKPVVFRADSLKEILEAMKFAKSFELKAIILGGQDAWKCADKLADQDVPVIITSVFDYPQSEFERFDAAYANAGKLHEAGVKFCFGYMDGTMAKLLNVQAGMSAAHGLPEDVAVRGLTLSAAEILGMDDKVGSIEVGKVADLIITTGNPIQASTRTVASFIDGEPVDLTSKHEREYEQFKNRPEPDLPPAPEDLNGPKPMRMN